MLASIPICRYQTLSALLNRIVNENGIDKRSRKNVGAIFYQCKRTGDKSDEDITHRAYDNPTFLSMRQLKQQAQEFLNLSIVFQIVISLKMVF